MLNIIRHLDSISFHVKWRPYGTQATVQMWFTIKNSAMLGLELEEYS